MYVLCTQLLEETKWSDFGLALSTCTPNFFGLLLISRLRKILEDRHTKMQYGKTSGPLRHCRCLGLDLFRKMIPDLPVLQMMGPFTKAHSLCNQCLHDLHCLKKASFSPNLCKLPRADINCNFMKTRSLCRTVHSMNYHHNFTLFFISFRTPSARIRSQVYLQRKSETLCVPSL